MLYVNMKMHMYVVRVSTCVSVQSLDCQNKELCSVLLIDTIQSLYEKRNACSIGPGS